MHSKLSYGSTPAADERNAIIGISLLAHETKNYILTIFKTLNGAAKVKDSSHFTNDLQANLRQN